MRMKGVFLMARQRIIKKRLLGSFSTLDLIVITLIGSLGVAISGIIGYMVRIVTSFLFIPGGAVAGGIYMLFLVIPVALIGKRSAAILTAVVQAIVVLVMPWAGSHGIATLITYTLPGIAIFVLLTTILRNHKCCCKMCCFFACMVANLTGVVLVSGVVMNLPLIPMLLGLTVGALSGGLGGLLTYSLAKKIKDLGVVFSE